MVINVVSISRSLAFVSLKRCSVLLVDETSFSPYAKGVREEQRTRNFNNYPKGK
jgi:hypothetical protein